MEFTFEKNLAVSSLDTVPEQFRHLYEERDGRYVLNDAHKGIAAAIDGLNKSLKAARRDADEARRSRLDPTAYAPVAQLLGVENTDAPTPDVLKAAAEKLIEKLGSSSQDQVNWDKMRKDLEASHQRAEAS